MCVCVLRKDFDIMDGAEEATTSVFMLLAGACIHLMALSAQVKKSNGKSGTITHLVYHRMLWSE